MTSSGEMQHDEARELIAAFALGAVEPDEAAAVRAHIDTCADCAADLRAEEEIASALDLVAASELPAGFADRVLAAVRTDGVATDAAGTRRPLESLPDVGEAAGEPERWVSTTTPEGWPAATSLPTAAETKAARRWFRPPQFLAGGLAAVIVVLSFFLVSTRNELSEKEDLVGALVGNEGIRLEGEHGQVGKMLPRDGGGLLVVRGLARSPRRLDYQLWYLDDGTPRSAGVFDVSSELTSVEIETPIRDADGAAITLEPEGGSEQPTTSPVMASG